jgi:hypothetical protein
MRDRKVSKNSIGPAIQADGTELTAQSMFGPPPLVAGEDPAAYGALLARISAAVKPADFLEEIWVRDVVDMTWDCLRMRRLKASLLTSAIGDGIDDLENLGWKVKGLSQQWKTSNRTTVVTKLAALGLSIDAPIAHVLATKIDQFDRIEQMIMNAEARRNIALREVDRHRANLAQALRQASDGVIDAEFKDVPPQQRTLGDAA